MKNRLSKFLIGFALVIPCLAGCGKNNSKEQKSSSQSQAASSVTSQTSESSQPQTNSSSVAENDDNPFAGDSDVPTYAGNTQRTVGTIENVPTKQYSEATKDKVAKMMCAVSGGAYDGKVRDQMVDYMIDLQIGEAVVVTFCDTLISFMGQMKKSNFSAEEFTNLCYNMLKVLNSIDASNAVDLLEKVNADALEAEKKEAKEDYDNATILSYYNPSIGSLNYNSYKELKNNAAKFSNSSQLQSDLSKYETVFNNYHFSDENVQRFNNYKADLLKKSTSDDYHIIPVEVIEYIKSHVGDAQKLYVNDLKLIVDAFAQHTYDFIDIFRKPSNELGIRQQYYTSYRNDLRTSDRVYQFLSILLENKQTTLGLCNSILADSRLGNLVLDFVRNVLVPIAENNWADSPDELNEIREFKSKVASLDSKNISALVSFVIKLANKVEDNDIKDLLTHVFTDETEFDYVKMGDKYVAVLDNVIASLTDTQKALLNQTSQVFGFNLIDELQNLSRIYKGKNLDTDDGKDKFVEDITNWYEPLLEKLSPLMLLVSGRGKKGGKAEEIKENGFFKISEHAFLSVSINTVYQGQTAQGIIENRTVYFNFGYYEQKENYSSTSSFMSGSLEDINEWISRLNSELAEMGEEEFAEYYNEEVVTVMRELGNNASFTQLSVSVDTSKYGYAPMTVSFKVNNDLYTTTFGVSISARDLPTIESGSMNYSSHYYISNQPNYFYTRVLDKGSEATLYAHGEDARADTSTAGWHYEYRKQNDYDYGCYFVYYVLDTANISRYQTYKSSRVGIYLQGANSFEVQPRSEVYYQYDNLEFYTYNYLQLENSSAVGKTANAKYSVNYEGMTYEYVVIANNNPVYTSYEFVIDNLGDEDITNPITVQAQLRIETTYETIIDDCYYCTYGYESRDGYVTLTNLTYVDDVVSFTYQGQTYTFLFD